ncbi:ATP-binding protein [Geomonas agri]|uniref:ATP-binding protein n=1 Tax=Geomonas agri TaxID=2873702 RepID=UPI001CD43634|nr:ATP-binding protein [Geomonas agri]
MFSRLFTTRRYALSLCFIWVLLIAVSLAWFYVQHKNNLDEVAKAQARIAFEKDLLYRKWASQHGGVYVPVTPQTQPNPYLAHIPDRDITTPSGKNLTLINPAYMTRQVFELAETEKQMARGHITSLNPIRGENAPDPWERKALESFEKGAKEASEVVTVGDHQFMRLMRPFKVENSCLKCHAAQGYKKGDIRGGISVTVPLAVFSVGSDRVLASTTATLLVIGMAGVCLILVGARKLSESSTRLEEKNAELLNEVTEREIAQEQLREQAVLLEEEVAERQAAQEEAVANQRRLQLIMDSTHAAIYGIDTSGRCTFANRTCLELTGYDNLDELLGKNMHDIIHHTLPSGLPAPVAHCSIFRAFTEGGGCTVRDEVFWHKDGTSFPVEYSSYPIVNDGVIEGAVVSFVDLTERIALEAQLRQAQKMEAVGQLAGGVAHDFNNVLQVISGYGSILKLDERLDERQKQEVDQILSAAERAAQLTRGLLAFSRKQVITLAPVNLNDVVESVRKFLVRIIGEDIQLKTTPSTGTLYIMADLGQLEQVLINLATNARDAMPKGGVLAIETGSQEVESPLDQESGEHKPGHYAVLTVADTGCGMDTETCKKIFEPFYTTKEVSKGTGLGMAIVYGIVKQHNGFINVYSEPGQGTTFRIYLPIYHSDGVRDHRDGKPAAPPQGGSETILVAEDDEGVRDLVLSVLTRFGYRVIQAVDGQDAVEKYLAHRDDIDMILMDLIMPRKNGKEAYDEIAAQAPEAKVLFASGYTADFIQKRGVPEEGIDLIMKPIQPIELLRSVREILDA